MLRTGPARRFRPEPANHRRARCARGEELSGKESAAGPAFCEWPRLIACDERASHRQRGMDGYEETDDDGEDGAGAKGPGAPRAQAGEEAGGSSREARESGRNRTFGGDGRVV